MNAIAVVALGGATDDAVIEQALRVLEGRMRAHGPLLTSPQAVRDYVRLRLANLEHEVFLVLFLDLCAVLSYVQHPHRSH